jgi:predicted metal-dependent hydrolase
VTRLFIALVIIAAAAVAYRKFNEQRDARLLAEAARKLQDERDACRARHPARPWTFPGEEL